jgi:hypothetical protein
MSELDDPQTTSSSDLSKARRVLAVSCASRPYSSVGVAVLLAQVSPVGAGRTVDVFDEIARLIEAARAEIDGEHRLGADGFAPVVELVDAHSIGVGCMPGKIEPGRALLARTDAILPIVGRDEVSARIADVRNLEIAHELDDVAAHAVLIGSGVAGLVDARIDRAAEMLEESAVQATIDLGNGEIAMRGDARPHGILLPWNPTF